MSGDRSLTRADLVQRSIVAGGALTAAGTLVGGLAVTASSAPSPTQDVEILNLALLVEYVSAGFYAAASDRGVLSGELEEFARIVGDQERQHVDFLREQLGSRARRRPRLEFGNAVTSRKRFVDTAILLEDLTVVAYNGQAPNLTPGALAAAARIVSVEARHAAWIRDLGGKNPAPLAADRPVSAAAATRALERTGFVKG
jgi:Ferritin-like domain